MKLRIPFNRPSITSVEEGYVRDALSRNQLSGDGHYTEEISHWFRQNLNIQNFYLTTSGTDALEMASILVDLKEGDEVIVPSFTFSSTVNAPMLSKARPIFIDIRPDTLNMDETLIEALITPKTKAIFTVDYAGVPCEMDEIMKIAAKYQIPVVEDAAQAVGSTYKGRYCGTLSEFGCYSFHATKNFSMGEGGGLVVNHPQYLERADIIREKGTDRRNMLRGLVDKYTWKDVGSSFLASDILAAMLLGQLERYEEISQNRMKIWERYHSHLLSLEEEGILRRPIIPKEIIHNAHMYYILLRNEAERESLREYLLSYGIGSAIHYIPLHSSPFGLSQGWKAEDCPVTEDISRRLLRLPLYADLSLSEVDEVCEHILSKRWLL